METSFDIERFTELCLRHISGYTTPAEDQELERFLELPGAMDRFMSMISKTEVEGEIPIWKDAELRSAANLERVGQAIEEYHRRPKVRSFPVWRVAASIVMLIGLGYYGIRQLVLVRHQKIADVPVVQTDLAPGKNRATLTLANGSKVSLDDLKNGKINDEKGASVTKVGDGLLTYSSNTDDKPDGSVHYNTLDVPRGGKYSVNLPDGSRVTLNSQSTLKYPTSFDGLTDRTVELTGEAFFEVRKDPSRPFRVKGGRQSVEVLGTSFNMKIYDDDPSALTTLITGTVRVDGVGKSIILKPGEQAVASERGLKLRNAADTAVVLAWRNGDFRFKNTPLQEVMRQLARWYNVKVTYSGGDADAGDGLTAAISRQLPASQVVKALELNGYHVKISDNEILITP